MAIATDLHTRPLTEALDPTMLRLIDTDIHNDLPSLQELRPFLAREWHPYLDNGGPKFAARYYANTGSGRMDDAVREEDGLCAGDPDWTIQQLMVKYRIDLGVLTGGLTGAVSIDYNARFLAALASAYNDWTLEPVMHFRASVQVRSALDAAQGPVEAGLPTIPPTIPAIMVPNRYAPVTLDSWTHRKSA